MTDQNHKPPVAPAGDTPEPKLYAPLEAQGYIPSAAITAESHRVEIPRAAPGPLTCPQGFATPPPGLMVYSEPPERHLAMGKAEADLIRSFLSAHDLDLNTMANVLEFGCSNSRVLRHFAPEARLPGHRYVGADMNANALLWSMTHLSPPFHYLVNTTAPHLPLPDASFDFVYALSVLSHIDALAFAWVYELARILAPGGIALLTILDEESLDFLVENGRFSALSQIKDPQEQSRFHQRFTQGELEMASFRKAQTSCLSFFRRSFFLRQIEHLFEPLDTRFGFMRSQTGLLLRRR